MKKNLFLSLSIVATFVVFTIACNDKDEPTNTDTNYPTGLKPNSAGALANVDEADFDEDIFTNLPASFSLDGPPIISQGSTNKCVSFSGGYYIQGMYNGLTSASGNTDAAGSVEFMHSQYKKVNPTENCADGAFMFDEGGSKTVGMSEILKTYGTCSSGQLPFIDSKTCTAIPANLVGEAAKNKTGDYKILDKSEFLNTDELKSWLYAGFPIWFAADVEDNFQDLKNGEVWTSSSGEATGHAMVLVGWDDTKKAFKVANSWGKNWASNGYGWIDYEYLKVQLKNNPSIGVIYPNDSQRTVFNKLSPASCGNANWGDLFIENNRNEEIAIEITNGGTYNNNDAENIDADETESYSGIPAGTLKVKVFKSDKSALIKEYDVKVVKCDETVLTVN